MYVPKTFEESRTEVLHQAIRDIGAGTVVSHGANGLEASHVPIELDPAGGRAGVLRCHFARPNPHAEALAQPTDVLVVFRGPEAYVTPSWYPTKAQTGQVVPTWNYAMVQVHGEACSYDDPDKLRRHLGALTDQFEARETLPWAVEDAPPAFIEQLMGGIVGIEIQIRSVEGKWKMSQNRPEADRRGVIVGLGSRAEGQDLEVAAAMGPDLDTTSAS